MFTLIIEKQQLMLDIKQQQQRYNNKCCRFTLSCISNESMNYDEEPCNQIELENENLSGNTSVLNLSNTSRNQQKIG